MKKNIKLFICMLLLFLCLGCSNTNDNNSSNDNVETQQEEVKPKTSSLVCTGPMAQGMFASMASYIENDSMQMIGKYDENDKLIQISYVYELNFSIEFTGESLETLKTAMNKVCDNSMFSSCDVDVTSTKAVIKADLDMDNLTQNQIDSYTKEQFKKEALTLSSDFVCEEN